MAFQHLLKGFCMVKISQRDLVGKAKEAIRTCLRRVPFLRFSIVEAQKSLSGMQPDLVVRVSSEDGQQILVFEAKSNGQPRLAREAVNQLKLRFPQGYGVFVAPYISPRTAEICSREGIGYVDFAGNCRLCFGKVFIEQEGRPNPLAEKRDLRSLYSPKAERVLRVLLTQPKRTWKFQALADEAKVSLGQVANVKKLLDDREWVRSEKEGFGLREPESLLTEWAQNYRFRRNEAREFYGLQSLSGIEAALADLCRNKGITYALTGFSAAARLAPAVRYQRAVAYVGDAIDDVASSLHLKPVPSGANVCLLSPYDDGVFYDARKPEGIQIVSPVQTYLDLRSSRGRGEEAAATLLEEVIRPSW